MATAIRVFVGVQVLWEWFWKMQHLWKLKPMKKPSRWPSKYWTTCYRTYIAVLAIHETDAMPTLLSVFGLGQEASCQGQRCGTRQPRQCSQPWLMTRLRNCRNFNLWRLCGKSLMTMYRTMQRTSFLSWRTLLNPRRWSCSITMWTIVMKCIRGRNFRRIWS